MARKPLRAGAAISVFFLLALFPPQRARARGHEPRTQELVDRLRSLLYRAERERAADRWLLRELRRLVRRYNWPWRVRLLWDDFRRRPDYAGPQWIVASGEFWRSRSEGMTSYYPPQELGRRPGDTAAELMGLFLEEIIERGKRGRRHRRWGFRRRDAAEIYIPLRVSNAFALRFRFTSRDNRPGTQLEFGPYLGPYRGRGYRLVYSPGRRTSFGLIRSSRGRSSVIELYRRRARLEDGREHLIEWRRSGRGRMAVFLDGTLIMKARDRAYQEPFEGFTIINRGGEYVFSGISLHGTHP